MSKSKNGDMVRTYFLAVEKAFFQYRQETEEGMRQTIELLSFLSQYKDYMFMKANGRSRSQSYM